MPPPLSLARLPLALLLLASFASAQPFVITTITGADFVFTGDGGPATQAQLSQMYHVLADAQGNVLVADRENHQILRISPQGILRVIAGNGIEGFSGDGGPATRASLSFPSAVAVDAAGNVYLADAGNRRVRRIGLDGAINTIAGTGRNGVAGNGGPAVNAELANPSGLAVDSGGALYIADSAAHLIRRVTGGGTINAFAGTGRGQYGGDGGQAAQASIKSPSHLAFDAAGNLYVADYGNDRVRRISPQGIISTFAGAGNTRSDGDGGPAAAANLIGPSGVFAAPNGSVYIAEFFNRVRVVNPSGVIGPFAGGDKRGFSGDGGPAANAQLSVLSAVTGDAQGNIYVADSVNLRIRRINAQGIISTFAGLGQHRYSGDGGPAVSASLAKPTGIASDGEGNVYIADPDNHRVRRIDGRGIITTYAGTGTAGLAGDGGPANQAQLNFPIHLAVDNAGNLFISDLLNSRIRRVNRNGIISTYAGGGTQLQPVDGTLATQVEMGGPASLAVDANGTLFVLDQPVCLIQRITPDGRLFRHAGKFLECGSSGDGGPAREATIHPQGTLSGGIGLDPQGNLYLAEPNPPAGAAANAGGRVRVIDAAGVIRPFAGNGVLGIATDLAAPTATSLYAPQSVLSDGGGGIFIGDGPFLYGVSDNLIFRIAGDVLAEDLGDGGAALDAYFFGVPAMALDLAGGRLVFVDVLDRRVRAIPFNPPTQDVSPGLLSFSADSGGAPAAPQYLSFAASIPGVAYAASVTSQQGGGSWLQVSPASGSAPRLIEVTADPAGLAPGNYTAEIAVQTPLALPARRTVAVTFRVGPAIPPRLGVDNPSFSFTVTRGSEPQSRALVVSNLGGGQAAFSVSASTTNGGAWLSASPAAGTATPRQAASILITADPAGLAAGTYVGRIAVAGPADAAALSVPVTLTISANDRAIRLSQSGLSFTAVARGGVIPTRAFEVVNLGRAAVDWTVSTSTLAGGTNWLSVTRTTGATQGGAGVAPPSVGVRIDQSGLAPGVYYGLVRVDAPGAANSPQVLTVGLEVLQEGSDPGAIVDPAELIFTTPAGSSPSSQEVLVYNVAQSLKTFRSTGELAGALLASLPKDQTLALNAPARVVVQPFTSTLAPGNYRGGLNLQFTDGRVRQVRVRVIVTGGAGNNLLSRTADGCAPTRLLPALTSLSASASVTAGWPIPLNIEVRDDCGGAQDDGSVVVTFSNGDAPVSLQSLKNGRWAGTWASRGASDSTTLKIEAAAPARSLAGAEQLTVAVRTQQAPPAVSSAGVVSAAGFESFAPLAPGGMISIFGERLADGLEAAGAFPLPTRLGGTRLVMAGREVPLLFVSPNQINAVAPSGLDVNTRHQLLVQRGTTYSSPVALDFAAAQPAIFAGAIGWIRPGATRQDPTPAVPATPSRAGDVIIIYGSGLGATSPEIPAGEQTPSSALSPLVGAISLRIGGVEAPVEFAGLAPGFGGLYQINARVPDGVAPGDAVEVVVTLEGLVSPAVTMAIR